MSKKMIRSLASIALVLCMLLTNLGGWNLSLAEDTHVEKSEEVNETNKETKAEPQGNEEEHRDEPQEENKEENQEGSEEAKNPSEEVQEEDKVKPLEQNTEAKDNLGLGIGGEIVPQAVGAGINVKEPKVNPVFYDDTTISGTNLAKAKVNKDTVIATVHVILKDSGGNEKANLTVTPKSGTKWSVDLPGGVKVAKGDTVTVYQQIGEDKSQEVNVTAQPSKASTVTLTMPTGEIWIEQTSSNIVNDDEKAEAIQMLKDANPTIANDIESVEFKITGVDPNKVASYTVTYTDKSKTEEIQAPGLTIKQVTEHSRGASLNDITIVDNEIKGKLAGEGPFDGIKVQLILNVKKEKSGDFCTDKGCKIDKDSSNPIEVNVQSDGTFSYTLQDKESLTLDQIVGVSVKEPHKFVSCSTTTVKPVIPEKTEVRDPRKLTAEDKKAIDAAIRKAYIVDGKSKLPNGTGDWDGVPAVIQIDDNGNVKIFSGNDVAGDWDWNNGGIFVPKKNDDGSVKIKEGAEPKITILAKDLVLNKAPEKPALKVEGGNVIITPDKVDTDAKKVEVTYTGKDGKSKTVTATKGQDGTWTTDDTEVSVDNKGVVTLPTSKVKSNTAVNAKVTDAGGIAEGDADEKTSVAGETTVTASVQTPSVTVDSTTGDVTVTPKDNDPDAKSMDITYTPAGSDTEKTVTAIKADDGKWSISGQTDFVASTDGKSFTIKNAKAKVKSKVKAITKGETDDIKSGVAENTVPDKTAPEAPTVKVNTSDGNAEITPPTDPDTKTVTVKYPDPSGNEKTAIATKDNDGWKITQGEDDGVTVDSTSGLIKIPYDKMKKADTVSATAKDEDGNESKPSTETTLPPVPTVEVTENKDITVTPPADRPAVNGMEVTYTPAGASAAKTIKIVKGNDNKWKLDGDPIEGISVDENSGVVTIKKGTAKDLSDVTAKSKIDETKKGLETATAKVPDTTAPEAPAVKVQDDGSVTITPKKDSDTKTVTVTYKDQDGVDKTATATKGDDDKWTVTGENGETIDETTGVITIPTGKSNPGDKVIAKAKDAAENESGPSEDTTKPAPPTVTPDQESGNVTITPPTKGNLDGMDITYKTTGENSVDRTVRVEKDSENKWKITGDNPDGLTVDEGTGLVTIPKGKAKEKTEVVANSTLGDKKAPAEKTPDNQHLVPDKTAPNPPTVKIEDNASITITPPKDEDTTSVTVTYKDKDGNEKTATATKDNNGWKMTKAENGETVDSNGVITIPKGNYKTEEAVTAYANDNVDNKSTEDNKTPVEVTFDGNTGTGNMEGKILLMSAKFTLPACTFAAPAGMQFAGWQVGNETKKAGDPITVNANTTVKATWKAKPVTPPSPNPGSGSDPDDRPYRPHRPHPSTPDKDKDKDSSDKSIIRLERGTHYRYIYGYPDGTVRPEGLITRAEAAALIARIAMLDMSDKAKPNFKDTPSMWYNSAINVVVKKNLMLADDGKFRPNEAITRAEFARALFYIDAKNAAVAPFADVKGHKFEEAINQAYGNGRIAGYPDGTFRPDAFIKRAEAAKILNHYAKRSVDHDGMKGVEVYTTHFTDLNERYWGYYEIMEAANTHEYERRVNTVLETWTKINNK